MMQTILLPPIRVFASHGRSLVGWAAPCGLATLFGLATMLRAQVDETYTPPRSTAAVASVASLLAPLGTAKVGGDLQVQAEVEARIARIATAQERRDWVSGLVAQILVPENSPAGRRFAVQQLRKIVELEDVGRLSAHLANPVAGPSMATLLASLPGREADRALRKAMPKAPPATRIALMRGLGARRSEAAVPALAGQLRQRDFDVVRVAAAALGEIGGQAAERALRLAFARALARRREEIGLALLRCGDHRRFGGDAEGAASIYRLLLGREEAVGLRMIALRGIAKTGGVTTFSELVRRLGNRDRRLALLAAQEIPRVRGLVLDSNRRRALLQAQLNPQTLIGLLQGFGARGKPDATPWVEEILDQLEARLGRGTAVSQAERGVQVVAMEVLAKLRGSVVVPRLVQSWNTADVAVGRGIHRILVGLRGAQVDLEIGRLLREGDLPVRVRTALIRVLGARAGHGAQATLVAVAQTDTAYPVRLAAVQHLSARHGSISLAAALALWARVTPRQERVALNLLLAHRVRKGGGAALQRFAAAREDLPRELHAAWARVLRLIGGGSAARVFATSFAGSPDEAQLAELSHWPDAGALPVLGAVTEGAAEPAARQRALEAYVSLLQRRNRGDIRAWRFAWRFAAPPTSSSQQLRRDVLQGMGRAGGAEDLSALRRALATPALRDAAARALQDVMSRHAQAEGVEAALVDLRAHARDPAVLEWAQGFSPGTKKR